MRFWGVLNHKIAFEGNLPQKYDKSVDSAFKIMARLIWGFKKQNLPYIFSFGCIFYKKSK
ncbi:MAG: hypothetical protein RL757_1533 [Bacteroidota bacterium]|jgi:hypothetical protein